MTDRKRNVFAILSLLLALLWTPCPAQKKYEREYHIKANAVPQRAQNFVSSVFNKAKIHWYVEESLTGKSIEAKFKAGGKRYSMEFDESGKIQDIEILIKIGKLDSKSRTTLKQNLSKKFSKYKIVKVQQHWNGSESQLKKALLEDELPKEIVKRYELILRAVKDKKEAYFEVLSEKDGAIVSIQEIIQRNSDNLIY